MLLQINTEERNISHGANFQPTENVKKIERDKEDTFIGKGSYQNTRNIRKQSRERKKKQFSV